MKKTRRWLAMLLAVVLVSSNVIYQLGTNMSASESDSTTEAPQQDDSAEEKAQQEAASNAHKKDSGEAKVQEVNTEEDKNASDTSKKTQVTEKAGADSKYMKEVKEGDSFNFEITVKNSFKLDKVTDQNNNTIQPKKVDGNVYTYKIADVKSDKTFHVLY